MAITKERRAELVKLYGEIIGQSDGFVLAEFNKMPMPKINELRAKLRPINGKFVVAKNTLFSLALKNAGWPVQDDLFHGPLAIAYGSGNFAAIAKETLAFIGAAENAEMLKVKGGVMVASILRTDQVEAISKLPGLDELRAQLAGLIAAPMTGLVGVINSATGQLVNVLQAYTNKEGGDAAA